MITQIHNHPGVPPVEDDISILSTSFFPDNGEACDISLRLQVRGKRIAALEQTIQELCAQRDALQLTNTIGQSLLAPIRKLPVEILADIFIQCIPTVHMPLDVNDPEFDPERMNGIHDVARSRHPTFIRLRLSQVSRRWRDIISDTPSMWTSLILNHSFPQGDYLSMVRPSLRNSKNYLLDVVIVPRAWHMPSEAIQETMKLLNGEIHRFRNFFADLKYTTGREVYLPLLFLSAPFPELTAMEAFGVWTGRCSDQEIIGEPNFPKLKSLDLWGPFSTPLLRSMTINSLPLLHRLRFKVTRTSLTETHSSFPTYYEQLESLHLDYHAWVHFGRSQHLQPLTMISLPLLKTLVIISLEPINARSLLPPLHIPSLQTLRLGVPQGFDESDDLTFGRASISWVFRQHYLVDIFDSLIDLTIDNASLTGNDIRQWLPRFVNLRSLKVIARAGARSFINDAFFAALAPIVQTPPLPPLRALAPTIPPTPPTTSTIVVSATAAVGGGIPACPKLERLILRRVSFLGRSADDLVALVRERSNFTTESDANASSGDTGRSSPYNPYHLRYLEIIRCHGISSRHFEEIRQMEMRGAIVKYRPVSSSSCSPSYPYPYRGVTDSEESGYD